MCDPVSAGIAMAVGAGVSLYGGMQQAKASQKAAQAVADQNRATQIAQNEGFTSRLQAGLAQTAAQTAASRETLASRSAAADQMRESQMSALKNYQDIINAQNAQAETLRRTGDTASQQLLERTNAAALQDAQTRRQQEAEALIADDLAQEGPQVSAPSDSVARSALARRTAEAATNIRSYGSKIATLSGYGAPNQAVGLNISDTAYGIMPAQMAQKLLESGSATRLLPTRTAYQSATGLGQARDTLLSSRGQNALDAAALSYGNATNLANLKQSNETTLASNRAAQEKANADAAKAQGAMISSLGNLAMYGGGYFGGNPLAAGGTFGSQGPLFGNPADISIAAGGPPLSPNSTLGSGGFLSNIFPVR